MFGGVETTKPGIGRTGLSQFCKVDTMLGLSLALWQTLPQINLNWTGDVYIDGLALAVVLWIVRMRR